MKNVHRSLIIVIILMVFNNVFSQNRISNQRFTAIGHRGAASIAPENTLASFKKAIDLTADYFELDVRTTSDDSLVIMHDDYVDRTTNGTGTVSSKTYSQIKALDAGSKFSAAFAGEKVPSLYETLKLAQDFNSKICIEIKSASVAKVIDLIQKMNMQKRVIIFSFNIEDLQTSKSIDSTIAVLYLTGSTQGSEAFQVKNMKGEYLGVGGSLSGPAYDFARLSGVKLWRWTVDDISEMKSEIEIGIDGIITNYPQLLVPFRDSLNATNVRQEPMMPNEFSLSQNYPNPFNPTTNISFGVPQNSIVKIIIYDMIGREVMTLVNKNYSSGFYTVPFNGNALTSSVYLYRMTSQSLNGNQKFFTSTKKFLLLK